MVRDKGTNDIKQIQVEVVKKADALSKLKIKLQKLKDKVSYDQTFTIDEKRLVKQNLEESYKKAVEKVNQAQTNKQVDNVRMYYILEFKKAFQVDKVKSKARAQIFEEAKKRKDYINRLTTVSVNEKNKANNLIESYVMKAINKLAMDMTTDEVIELTKVTINEIEHVKVKQFENEFGLANKQGMTSENLDNKLNSSTNHLKLATLPNTGNNGNSLLSLSEFMLLSGLLLLLKRRKKEN